MLQRIPFALAALGMFGGVLIAIFFGIGEDWFKDRIAAGLERNAVIQAIEDPAARAAEVAAEKSKCWRYYLRYHFHATGLGAMSLALLLLVNRMRASRTLERVASYLVAIGGLLYPFVWLFAAIYGPEMGRHEAKEAFALFGYSGGLVLVGIALILFLIFRAEVISEGAPPAAPGP